MAFNIIAYETRTLTDNTATSLFTFVLPTTLDALGGRVDYQLYNTDGTDVQSVAGSFLFSAVNKAGTLTVAVNNADATASDQDATAVSAGTATAVPSIAASGTTATVSFLSNTSLTPTTMEMRYLVRWFSNGTANSRVIPITFVNA
jgi:hypothetical protein